MLNQDSVIFELQDGIARATLNRPDVLNALTVDMIRLLDERLSAWAGDSSVRAVMLAGAGEKAFCAGADMRALGKEVQAGNHAAMLEFFRSEYRLHYRIATYPKPIMSIVNGMVMGSGAGIAFGAPIRVVTEHAAFAMPECTYGFFPASGAGRFLNDCPGSIGLFLALTGQRLKTAGIRYCGLATHGVEAKDLSELSFERLDSLDKPVRMADIERIRPGIDLCFGFESLGEILTVLATRKDKGAKDSLRLLGWASPFSLRATHEHMRRSKGKNLRDILIEEMRIATRLVRRPDFAEGLRAFLMDGDKKPTWNPARVGDIVHQEVAALFEPLDDGMELSLPSF